jgi:hypothetical protein
MTLNIIYEFCFIRNLNIAARPIMLSDWPKYLLLNNHMGYGNVTWSQPQDTVLTYIVQITCRMLWKWISFFLSESWLNPNCRLWLITKLSYFVSIQNPIWPPLFDKFNHISRTIWWKYLKTILVYKHWTVWLECSLEWVSDGCLMPDEQFFSYIMEYKLHSMRW